MCRSRDRLGNADKLPLRQMAASLFSNSSARMIFSDIVLCSTQLAIDTRKFNVAGGYPPLKKIHQGSKPIIVFTDGAAKGNPGPGGWAAVIVMPEGWVREFGGGSPR